MEAEGLSFHLVYRSPGTLLFGRITYLSLDLTFYALPVLFYHPPARPWRPKRNFEAIDVPLLAKEDVLKAGDPPRRFIEVALILQAILTVSEVTSDAASTGYADLEAAPEVTTTDRFYY